MECKKGQTLIETAIILPILLLLILGIFEFGRAMYIKNTLTNASRAGARAAVVQTGLPLGVSSCGAFNSDCTNQGTSGVCLTACKSIFSGIPKDEVAVTIDITDVNASGNTDSGDLVKVNVTWNNFHTVTFTYTGLNLALTNTLAGEASMRYE